MVASSARRKTDIDTPYYGSTTRLPTHTQLLDDSLAFLAEPTPEALAEALRQALADRAEAQRRATRGVALIEREYSEPRYLEKVRTAYAHVAAAVESRRRPFAPAVGGGPAPPRAV